MKESPLVPFAEDLLVDLSATGLADGNGLREAVGKLLLELLGLRVVVARISRISGAMTNVIFRVDCSEGPSYLLRVYGQGLDWMFSRQRERLWSKILAGCGICPRWVAMFGNGRLEEWVEGITLTAPMMREEQMFKQIAKIMRRMHVDGSLAIRTFLEEEPVNNLWSRLDRWQARAVEVWDRVVALHQGREAELKLAKSFLNIPAWLKRLRNDLENDQEIAVSHCDLQNGNIMLRHDPSQIILVDFEYACWAPAAFDIANHFCEWGADYCHPEHPHLVDYTKGPSMDQMRRFLMHYDPSSEGELFEKIQRYIVVSHLLWGYWGIIQSGQPSIISFDYLGYAHNRFIQASQSEWASHAGPMET